MFYVNPLQRIGYVFAPYVAFYVTGIHTFHTAIIIIMVDGNMKFISSVNQDISRVSKGTSKIPCSTLEI